MNFKNITSLTFRNIKIDRKNMNKEQKELCNRMSFALKSKDEYCKLAKNKNDIYICMLAKNLGIELKFLDFYKGKFIRDNNGEEISIFVADTICRFKVLVELIINTLKNIKKGLF